jgi:hypothetical protein
MSGYGCLYAYVGCVGVCVCVCGAFIYTVLSLRNLRCEPVRMDGFGLHAYIILALTTSSNIFSSLPFFFLSSFVLRAQAF